MTAKPGLRIERHKAERLRHCDIRLGSIYEFPYADSDAIEYDFEFVASTINYLCRRWLAIVWTDSSRKEKIALALLR